MERCPRCKKEAVTHVPSGDEINPYNVFHDFAETLDPNERWKIPFVGQTYPSPEYPEDVPTVKCGRCSEEFNKDEEQIDLPEEIQRE